MAVERIAEVGQKHRAQTEGFDPVADRFDVAGAEQRAGEHIHLFAPPAGTLAWRHQRGDDRFDRSGKSAFEGAVEVGRVHRNDGDVGIFRVLAAEFAHQPLDVGALRFGQAGGGQTDHVRRVLGADRLQSVDDVRVGAHHRRNLVHRRRLQRDRLAEMAHEKDLAKGGAALRAVQHRDGVLEAEESQRGADRRARLQRVDRQGLGATDDLGHCVLLRRPAACRACARRPTARGGEPLPTPAIRSKAPAGARVRAFPNSRRSRIRVPD